ncbi:MAG TPA: hypothetical protein VF637_07650, partial [Sphingomicrobium sp.]
LLGRCAADRPHRCRSAISRPYPDRVGSPHSKTSLPGDGGRPRTTTNGFDKVVTSPVRLDYWVNPAS